MHIAPSAQRRSSFAQMPRAFAFHELGRPYSEHPRSFGPSPSALVGQLRSLVRADADNFLVPVPVAYVAPNAASAAVMP